MPVPQAESSTLATVIVYGVLISLSGLSLWWLWTRDIIRPGSFHRAELRCREPWRVPVMIWGVGVFIALAAQMLGLALTLVFPQWIGIDGSPQYQTVTYGGIFVAEIVSVVVLVALVQAVLRDREAVRRAGLGPPRAVDLPIGLGGTALVLPLCLVAGWLAGLIAEWSTGRPIDPISHEMLHELLDKPSEPWNWGLIATVVIAAPVIEELLFRVFLQSTLVGACNWVMGSFDEGVPPAEAADPASTPAVKPRGSTRGRWMGIAITSVLFALMHLGVVTPSGTLADGWHALVPIFVLSMGLGIAYERTGRWLVPMTMHAAFNAINVALALAIGGS